MRRAICYGLAAALAAGCGPTSQRLERPAPQDEVSVGYGTQNRHDVTGAVTSVSPTEAETRVPRIEQLLQGRVPGLEVLPLRLHDGSQELSFFSTISTFGTANDITLAELSVEAFYPADAHTSAVLLGGEPPRRVRDGVATAEAPAAQPR